MDRRRLRPVGVRADERAVSDIVGSILLVGITVIAAVGFGLLILSFDGPPDTQHSRLVVTMAPGLGGWNSGDEEIRLAHLGGEPLDADAVRITYTPPAGSAVTLSGGSLGSDFADDGQLTTGEVWVLVLTAALNDLYDIRVVVESAGRTQLVADTTVVAGSTGGGVLCLGDVTAPTAAFSAADVNSLSSGPVAVSVTLSDNCAGVNETVAPHLWWCVAVTCAVPGDYTDAGAMTDTGLRMWSANVPSHVWLTQAIAGASLRYYVTGMTDNNGNVAQSGVQVDLVNLILGYTYVDSATATTGSVASLDAAKQEADTVEADLAEAAVVVPPGTGGPTKFSGTTATAEGAAADPSNALASDDQRAVLDADDEAVYISGLDLPSEAVTVTAVDIGFEGRRESDPGGTNPTASLDYHNGVTWNLQATPTAVSSTTDADITRTLTGPFTVADVESMAVRVLVDVGNGANKRSLEIDHIFATVTYTTSAGTFQRMNITLDWTGVDPGTVQRVELMYRVTGDTFNVQAWNFLTSAWRTCAGTLTAAALTSYSCSLVLPGEYSSGAVRIRFTDVATTGTTQGHLFLDHARVGTA